MGSAHEHNTSLWIATTRSTLDAVDATAADLTGRVDVAVVGAGIFGLTLARRLAGAGASVVVLEAGSLAAGATGNTTAKVSALQGTTLSELRDRVGEERTAVYAAANLAAVEHVAQLVAEDGIECDFERASACTFATDAAGAAQIAAEQQAALSAGVPARLGSTPELPFPTSAAVWLDDQAQFHPRRYCLGLAEAIVRDGGRVLSHIRVLDVDQNERGCTVATDQGSLEADRVVLATHLPFLAAGGYFARAHPQRSYAIAARVGGPRLTGMYLGTDEPARSLRSTPDGWTIIGGEGHKVGHDDDTEQRYRALVTWAEGVFAGVEVGHRWSAQDYTTVDGVPYVGPLTARSTRVWVATGFRKWGMTNGTAAAVLLDDRLAGRDSPWTETFDSTRRAPRASLSSLVTENLDVGKRLVGDRLRTLHPPPIEDLAIGEGRICRADGDTVAAYRDTSGDLHVVAPDCTHLGCRVAFNTAERSWDCPCHGSRFAIDGEVLQGPATANLTRHTPPD